jgi:hypothetical protein
MDLDDLRKWLEHKRDHDPVELPGPDFGLLPEHAVGLVPGPDAVAQLELFLFRRAQSAGAKLVVASPRPGRELRTQLRYAGYDPETLERQELLTIATLGRPRLGEVLDFWRTTAQRAGSSPAWVVSSCFLHLQADFEEVLRAEQVLSDILVSSQLVAICIYCYRSLSPDQVLALCRTHSGAVMYDPARPCFLRQAPLP